MKTIEERIREKVETKLRDEINDLFGPICARIVEGSRGGDAVYDITLLEVAYNRNTIIQEMQVLIFKQEIDKRIETAIMEFMAKVEG